MRLFFSCLVATVFFLPPLQAQSIPPIINGVQNGPLLDELSGQYQSSLFSASNADFAQTVHNWRLFLLSMQEYAASIDFDIKGVKVWLKIYWAKDGSIDHIAYILSDRSININPQDWEAFLRSFMRNYKLPITHIKPFSYENPISFPLPYQRQK